MIIDAHAHAARDYASAASIAETSQRYGIARVLLCTSPKNNLDLKEPPNFPFLKTPDSIFLLNRMLRFGYNHFIKDNGDGNQHVLALAQQAPEIVVPFLWVNPLDLQQVSNLEQNLQTGPVRGIKLHQAWDAFTIEGDEFGRVAEVARALRLPIFIHLYTKPEAQKLARFIAGHADGTFIIAHMLGLDIFAEKRRSLANVYFDTSGSARVRGEDILHAIQTFGHEHVVFGTDTPYAGIADQIAKIERLKLSDDVQEHIFRLNIERILNN